MSKRNKLSYSKLVQVYESGENNSLLIIHNSNNSMLRTIFSQDDNGNSNSFRAEFYRLEKNKKDILEVSNLFSQVFESSMKKF